MTTLTTALANVCAHVLREQATFGGTALERLDAYIAWEGESPATSFLRAHPALFDTILCQAGQHLAVTNGNAPQSFGELPQIPNQRTTP